MSSNSNVILNFNLNLWFPILLHHSERHSNGATPGQQLKSGLVHYVLAICAMDPLSYIILHSCSQRIFRQTTGYRLIVTEIKGCKYLAKRFRKNKGFNIYCICWGISVIIQSNVVVPTLTITETASLWNVFFSSLLHLNNLTLLYQEKAVFNINLLFLHLSSTCACFNMTLRQFGSLLCGNIKIAHAWCGNLKLPRRKHWE